jgi:hypothetical protein
MLNNEWVAITSPTGILIREAAKDRYWFGTIPFNNICWINVGVRPEIWISQGNSGYNPFRSRVHSVSLLPLVALLDSDLVRFFPKEQMVMRHEIKGNSFPYILESDVNLQRSSDLKFLRFRPFAGNGIHYLKFGDRDVGPLFPLKLFPDRVQGFLRGSSLPEGQPDIDQKESSGNLGPKELFLVLGCAVALGGFVVLFKILDKVYLDPGFNVNMAVGGFFLALAIFVTGGIFVLSYVFP